MKSFQKKWPLPLKLFAITVVVAIPVVVVMLVFHPFIARKSARHYSTQYPLTEIFTKKDISRVTETMRSDGEFAFYFLVLSENHVDRATEEIYQNLKNKRTEAKHRRQIDTAMSEIKSMGMLVNSFSYPDDFFVNPEDYPVLGNTLFGFFYDEFKLAVMGLIYKSIYDKSFQFRWDQDSRDLALKVRKMVIQLRENGSLHQWRDSNN